MIRAETHQSEIAWNEISVLMKRRAAGTGTGTGTGTGLGQPLLQGPARMAVPGLGTRGAGVRIVGSAL